MKESLPDLERATIIQVSTRIQSWSWDRLSAFQQPNSKTGSTLATLSCLNDLLLRGQRAGLSQPHTTSTTTLKNRVLLGSKIYIASCGWMQPKSKVHLFQYKDKSFFPLTEREKRDFTQTQPEPERKSSSRGGGVDANPWRAMWNCPGATHRRWRTALSEQRPQKVGSGRAVCTSCASANLRGNLFHYKR